MKEKLYNMRIEDGQLVIPGTDFMLAEFSAANELIPLKENWAERWCYLPTSYDAVMDALLRFEIRPDDVFVNTFMKCGTTWMQETAWLLLNNLDFERAKNTELMVRSPNLDGSGVNKHEISTLTQCNQLSSPRLMKSHLPPNLLPQQVWEKRAKIIYVARNVKDCVTSCYPFLKNLGVPYSSFEEFVDDFINNKIMYMPYLERLVDFWKMRHEPNVFFVTYEEMKRDLPGVLQRLCIFLGRPELTPEELQKTVDHLSFEKMKGNKSAHIHDYIANLVNTIPNEEFSFMRRGIIGSYKDEMSLELQQKRDNYTSQILSKHGLKEEDIFGSF